jgi:hypothetical protein
MRESDGSFDRQSRGHPEGEIGAHDLRCLSALRPLDSHAVTRFNFSLPVRDASGDRGSHAERAVNIDEDRAAFSAISILRSFVIPSARFFPRALSFRAAHERTDLDHTVSSVAPWFGCAVVFVSGLADFVVAMHPA